MAFLKFGRLGEAISGDGVIYPVRYRTERGATIPYIPTKNDMNNCGNAKFAGIECPRKVGGSAPLLNCADCSLHPDNNIPSREEESVSRR